MPPQDGSAPIVHCGKAQSLPNSDRESPEVVARARSNSEPQPPQLEETSVQQASNTVQQASGSTQLASGLLQQGPYSVQQASSSASGSVQQASGIVQQVSGNTAATDSPSRKPVPKPRRTKKPDGAGNAAGMESSSEESPTHYNEQQATGQEEQATQLETSGILVSMNC